MTIAANVWFGGNPPIGVALQIDYSENREISDGRIEGLSADQLAWFGALGRCLRKLYSVTI